MFLALVFTSSLVWAQSAVLVANHPVEATVLPPAGQPSPGAPLIMEITLGLRNRGALNQLLADLQNPSSPGYHRWLSSAEFDRRFGPAARDFGAVVRWLSSQGFKIHSADPGARSIQFTGPVFLVERAFGTRLAVFGDGSLYANNSDPLIPSQFAGVISAIHGLDNLGRSYPLGRAALRSLTQLSAAGPGLAPLLLAEWSDPEPEESASSQPDATVGTSGPTFGPGDLQTFYDETPQLKAGINGGKGDCAAVVGNSDFLDAAINLFNSQFGLPPSSITRVLADSANPGLTADEFEALWDQEWLHTVAPGTPITFYLGNDAKATVDGISDAIKRAVNDNKCGVINISFGFCGKADSYFTGFLDPLFAKAAAQGQSIFVAQGDAGAADVVLDPKTMNCVSGTTRNVNEIGSDPNVTSVGGTQFTPKYDPSGNDVGFVPERVWNDASGAGAGGTSRLFSKPAYQAGVTPADGKRDVPDISAGASRISPGFFVADDSGGKAVIDSGSGFGTSLGAPMWSGITKLIAQVTAARVGNLNPRLYALGKLGDSSKSGIRDVTAGNNNFNGVTGFNAVPGYDQASGWGTPDINVLVSAFQPAGVPSIGSVTSPILVGASFVINGNNFTPGSRVNFFVATATGPINEGPIKPTAQSATQLTVGVAPTVPLGEGFVDLQVVNTDKGFTVSNPAAALLQGSAKAGIPSLTGINGVPLAATSSDPSFATNNVETVVAQGATVKLDGTGFDTADGVAVDLFCACPGNKVGPFFLNPGDPGLSATQISFLIPGSGSNAPVTGPGSFVISNKGAAGAYAMKSNAVSVPIGEKISVTSVTQSGTAITVQGTGFSRLTVINFFNAQGGTAVNLGGLTGAGAAKIPLALVNANKFTFGSPAGAVPGASYVQALNPPYVPFTSTGTDPGGGFTLK